MITAILSTISLIMFILFVLVFCFITVILATSLRACLKIHSKIRHEQEYMVKYNKRMYEAMDKKFSVKQ